MKIGMTLALAFLAITACTAQTTTDPVAGEADLLVTEFGDSVARSFREDDRTIVTELLDADDALVAWMRHDEIDGTTTLEVTGQPGSLEPYLSPRVDLSVVHNVVATAWRSASPSLVDYAATCTLGSNVPFSCDGQCALPAPYQQFGIGPVRGLYSRSTCEARARACSSAATVVAHANYDYAPYSQVTVCYWMY